MAVLQSGGVVMSAGRAPSASSRSMSLHGVRISYGEIYRVQPAVRTVVDFRARNVAQLGWHGFERTVDGKDRIRLRTGNVAHLLRRPNPYMSRYSWVFGVVADLDIYDFHLSVKVRDKDGNLSLWPIPAEQVTPIGGTWVAPDKYRIGTGLEVPRDMCFVVHGYSPFSASEGMSVLEAIRQVLAGDRAAEEYREGFWRRGAQISGVIERPADAPKFTMETLNRFRSQWQDRYGANGTDAGGTPILEDGMVYRQLGSTVKDSGYLDARKMTREEVAALMHISPVMVGLMDGANYSNVKEFRSSLYQDALGPIITQLEEEFEWQVIPEIADPSRVYVELNWREKLRGSFEEQAGIISTSVGGPIMTRNEGRGLMNLPRIDDPTYDELIVPLNVVLGGQASPQDSAPPKAIDAQAVKALPPAGHKATGIRITSTPDQVDIMSSTLAKAFTRQERAVVAKLGGKASKSATDVFDVARFDRELSADMHAASLAIAEPVVAGVVNSSGTGNDPADYVAGMTAYLAKKSAAQAAATNASTLADLEDSLGEPDPTAAVKTLFERYREVRAKSDAIGLTTAIVGFAAVDTAKVNGGATKTWIVTSAKSRHPQLDGETVPIDGTFSNGADWPGDDSAGVDEAAGCQCDVEINYGG